jgi:hypothetical protein
MGIVRFLPATPDPEIEALTCIETSGPGQPRLTVEGLQKKFASVLKARIQYSPPEACEAVEVLSSARTPAGNGVGASVSERGSLDPHAPGSIARAVDRRPAF